MAPLEVWGQSMGVKKAIVELADAKEQGFFSIGRAAEISGVTAKMIRHYESLGLLPKVARTLGDYRVYTESEIHTLRFIRRARGLGFSMTEIGDLLGLWRNQRRASKEVKRLALKHVAELDSKIEELQSMRTALAELAAHCHGDARPDCPILDDLSQIGSDKEGHCHEA
jgi:MerR family copper efflux transcriptional regulator